MKPRKMLPKTIPAADVNRAYRFYRDVFDFLRDPIDQTTLIVDKQPISFFQSNEKAKIEILARDHIEVLIHHLENNFIAIQSIENKNNSKVAVHIFDSEKNEVVIEVNR